MMYFPKEWFIIIPDPSTLDILLYYFGHTKPMPYCLSDCFKGSSTPFRL